MTKPAAATNFTLTITPNEAYYKEAYDEMISTLRLKKYEPYFAVSIVVFGTGLFFYDEEGVLGMFPFVFSMAGLYELYKVFTEKNKWLKARLDSRLVGQKIEFTFNDAGILHTGPFSNGEMKWEGIHNILKTKRGLLIKPENGSSLYLPDHIFSDKTQMEFILSKKNEAA
jgi:hypothetical protein